MRAGARRSERACPRCVSEQNLWCIECTPQVFAALPLWASSQVDKRVPLPSTRTYPPVSHHPMPARRTPSRSPAKARPTKASAAAPAAALQGRSRDHPYVIGVPWWLEDADPSERASDWATGHTRYAGIMLGFAALALLGLRFFPPAWTTSPADVAASALLSPAWLCGLRAAAALLVLLLVLHLVLGPAKTQSESRLDGSEVFLRIGGCWRLGGLTQCGWILVGCCSNPNR
jgi:hypothetical protein